MNFAVNSNRNGVLQERAAKEVGTRIGARIAPDSLLCMEKARIFLKFAKMPAWHLKPLGQSSEKNVKVNRNGVRYC